LNALAVVVLFVGQSVIHERW